MVSSLTYESDLQCQGEVGLTILTVTGNLPVAVSRRQAARTIVIEKQPAAQWVCKKRDLYHNTMESFLFDIKIHLFHG